MIISIMIALVFLFIISVLDLKTLNLKDGFIPSAITSSFLVFAFILGDPSKVIYFGLFGSLIALLLVDFRIFYGLADLKVLIASSMTLPSFDSVLTFVVLVMVCSLIIKGISKWKFKKKKTIAFVPIIFLAYIINLLVFLIY